MAGSTGRDIRRDAQRRMEQMQQKVPYMRQGNMRNNFYRNNTDGSANNSFPQRNMQEISTEKEHTEEAPKPAANESFRLPLGIGSGLEKYLEHLDTDKILIIALLAMIYKDGGNKKLMMALAYLLT